MSFLVEQIREQKLLEMEVSVDEFIKENDISNKAMIHTIEFDKEVYASEKEVREYLKDKYMNAEDIEDSGDSYVARINSPSQFDDETETTVEVRRGIRATAADLLMIPTMESINFNDKGETAFTTTDLFSKEKTIDLKDGLPHIIEIARVAEGEHPAYGKLKITQEHLESFEQNFKSKASGVDLAVNEDHKKNEAFGWFKDVFLSFDRQVLYGQIKWNSKGTAALSEKQYRYFSPEFRFNYVHPHSGIEYGPTLLGGALTNYPFLKMEAITELNHKKQGEKIVKEKTEATIDLSVHESKILELSGKLNEATDKANTAQAKVVELSEKVDSLEAEIAQKKKESANKALFDQGKINKAQLVALNEGKGMLEVLALSEKMNTKPTGADSNPTTETIELSEADKKVAKQLGLTDEEFIAGNKE